MRYVIIAKRRSGDAIRPCEYVSKSGLISYNANNAYPFKTLKHAQTDMEYFADLYREYSFHLEQIMAGKLANAILRGKLVERE